MLLTDREGVPIGVNVSSASPHEVRLIEPLVDDTLVDLPQQTRLLYDKAADSRSLRDGLSRLGVRLISPFRKRRDGSQQRMCQRDRRHYSHRYKVERTFSWLKQLRRLGTRWEYHAHLFQGFWQLGCLFTILKAF
jgi:transposase